MNTVKKYLANVARFTKQDIDVVTLQILFAAILTGVVILNLMMK